MRISIRIKWAMLITVIFVLFVVAFGYAFSQATALYVERQDEKAEISLKLSASQVINKIDTYKKELLILANLSNLDKFLNVYENHNSANDDNNVVVSVDTDVNLQGLEDTFWTFVKSNKELMQVRYIDKSGQEIVFVERLSPNEQPVIRRGKELENNADRHYFQEAIKLEKDSVYISELDLHEENGVIDFPYKPVIRLATPVFDEAGNNQGIVIINFFGDAILSYIRVVPFEHVQFVDEEGYYIYNSDDHLSEWGKQLDLFSRQQFVVSGDTRLSALLRTSNFFSYSCLDPFMSDNCYAYYYKIPYDDLNSRRYWTIITRIDRSEFFDQLRPTQNRALLGYGVALLIAAIISYLSITRITKPLKLLANSIKRLDLGDYNINIPIVSKDEFGDVTKALNKLISSERQKEKERYEFITSASHQLRTPISSVRLALDNLYEDLSKQKIPKKTLENIDWISLDLQRTVVLLDDMLTYLELGENYFATNLEKVKFRELVEGVVDSHQDEIKQKKIKIKLRISKNIHIRCELENLKKAINHLLTNAIEYSNNNGGIAISAEENQSKIICRITDQGIGIPRKEQVNLFSKFFRARNAYLKRSVGSGLGLVIAKNVIEGHGGEIKIESNEKQGTKVTFTLLQR